MRESLKDICCKQRFRIISEFYTIHKEVLKPFGIEVQHPDDFLANHLNLAPGKFCVAVRKVRARLKNPPYSVEDYLATLTRQGLVVTVAELEQYAQLI